MEDPLKRLAADFSNLLINGQAFSDVAFNVEGKQIYAHKCVLAARSRFFRMVFSSNSSSPLVIPISVVGHDVFMVILQFLYSGQVLLGEPRVNLAIETLHAAQLFGIEELVILVQKELAVMAEKAPIQDIMKILMTARKQDLLQLWAVSSSLVAKSGLSSDALRNHLPAEIVSDIESIRQKCGYYSGITGDNPDIYDQRIVRMQRALDSSDVELVKLMVMEEGLDLDKAKALHYAVANCGCNVVRLLLQLKLVNVDATDTEGRTVLHIAGALVDPEVIALLLDNNASPNARTPAGCTALDIVRNKAYQALNEESTAGVTIDHSRIKLCVELLQCAESTQCLPRAGEQTSMLDFYTQSVDGPKGTSPPWSEKEEVIDPIGMVPNHALPGYGELHQMPIPDIPLVQ